MIRLQVIQRELSGLDLLRGEGAEMTGPSAEDADVQERIAHQPVPAVDSSRDLSGGVEILHRRLALGIDRQAAVLVMLGREDQDGIYPHVDVEALELPEHRGEHLLDRPLAVELLDQRGVEPHADHAGGGDDALLPVPAFLDDRGRLAVARLELVDEAVPLAVAEVSAEAADLLGDQEPQNLLGKGRPGGVILDRDRLNSS